MKNITLRYGLIAGAIVSILMLLSFPLMYNLKDNYNTALILGYVSIVLSLTTIFVAVKTYRDKHNSGKVNVGKAFLIGLYITLIAGAIYSLVFLIADSFAEVSFMEHYRSMKLDEINANEALDAMQKQAQITEMDSQIAMYSNPIAGFLIIMFSEYVPAGIIISLVTALILKKK